MERGLLLCLICLFPAVSSQGANPNPFKVKEDAESITLTCTTGKFESVENDTVTLQLDVSTEYTYSCCNDRQGDQDPLCNKITVKIRSPDDLIQIDTVTFISVIVSNIAATALIGWAIYSICAQPKTKSSYQNNKASDKVNLINNSAGDTYQPLSGRSDEYSTLGPKSKSRN